MAKPEWGIKRICPSCGTRYYDFGKPLGEIVCPKCSTQFDPEAFLKTRRARVAAQPEKELEPVSAEEIDPDLEVEEEAEVAEEDEDAIPAEEGEEEDEELIEDASELGEDEDDMAEVIDNVDDEEER
ncbi:MAG TPA: TIGR02300 family protein [Stellaceae bacterium]